MDQYLPYILSLNLTLTIIDAAVGYHAAPLLMHAGEADEETAADMTKSIRAMLALVVTLYSFFSCFAFYRQKPVMLVVLTAIIIADILAQTAISRRIKTRNQ